jgi:hypothetical protein
VQVLGGAAEAAVAHHRVERDQRFEVDGHSATLPANTIYFTDQQRRIFPLFSIYINT